MDFTNLNQLDKGEKTPQPENTNSKMWKGHAKKWVVPSSRIIGARVEPKRKQKKGGRCTEVRPL